MKHEFYQCTAHSSFTLRLSARSQNTQLPMIGITPNTKRREKPTLHKQLKTAPRFLGHLLLIRARCVLHPVSSFFWQKVNLRSLSGINDNEHNFIHKQNHFLYQKGVSSRDTGQHFWSAHVLLRDADTQQINYHRGRERVD